jgi:hypothetical protein
MYTVTNIDNIKKTFTSDSQLIDYTKQIVVENGDTDFSILGVSDAIEYLSEYCPDLIFEQN